MLGRLLVALGIGLVALGVGVLVLAKVPFFGKLPGDIHIQSGNFTCFAPIVSMLILSLLLSLILNVIAKFLNP